MKKGSSDNKNHKKHGFIMIAGSLILCGAYITYLIGASKMGVSSQENSITATIVFLLLYMTFYILAGSKNVNIIRQNKILIINMLLLFVPLAVAIACYLLTKNFLISVIVFIGGQIAYTIYYKNYFPVPGYNKAYKAYLKGDNNSAKDQLEEILNKYPENFESLILLGVLHIKEMEYHKAITLLEKAKKQKADSPLVYINLSNAHTALEEFDAAIENSKMTLELASENWNACYTIAISSLFTENYTQAIEYFNRVQMFKIPAQQEFLIHYGKAIAFQKNSNPEDASKELEKSVQKANTLTITYWENQLEKIKNFENKPSKMVKDAISYVKSQNKEA